MKIIIKKPKRGAANAWIEKTNVLAGLTIEEAKNIFDIARAHGSPRLQKIYDEIELTDALLATCVDRRAAALSQLGWKITADPNADETLAEEERIALETFVRGIDNLSDAIEHLDLAFFRGLSVVQPIWNGLSVGHINLLNSWNFLFDDDKSLLWNPNASLNVNDCEPVVPEMRLVELRRPRPIDYPSLAIHIRKYLGERDWGRFIERYGIPPIDVIMAANTNDKQRDDYVEAADRSRDGLSGVWPSGSQISRAEGSRGQDPFSAFIEHQEKLIVLRATGGTLTSLAQADTGSLAGGAQMDVWKEIVSRDSDIISDALNRHLFWKFLSLKFPGQPIVVSFSIGKEKELSAMEAADLAAKLKTAGFLVDKDELEEAVGFTLTVAPEPAMGGTQQPLFNKAEPPASRVTNEVDDDVLAAFAKDVGPAAEAVKALLDNPTPEAAKALIDKLPELMPEDPALAAVIAEAMAKEFGATRIGN